MTATDGDSSLQHVLVGGYTPDEGSARGVTSYLRGGGVTLREVDALPLPSPTYLIAHPGRPWVFAVSETSPSSVSSLRVAADGSLTLLSTVPTGGDAACHLALSPDGRSLAVAHYGSGSVSSFAVDAEGRLERQQVLQLQGSGPDPDRQEGPHAHQVVWHDGEVLVPDLGTDRIHRLRLDVAGGWGEAAPPVQLPPGSGPRHLVVTGDHLVVACELAGTLWSARRTADDGWAGVGSVPASSRPDGPGQPSGLRLHGDRLLVANRGPGTVASFGLDRESGRLQPESEFDCGGGSPRDLTLDGDLLWVSNQADDRLDVFALAPWPPSAPAFTVASPTPACVLVLEPDDSVDA